MSSIGSPIGDMLARIRNAQQRGKARVLVPASTFRNGVLHVLKEEGYIRDYKMHELPHSGAEFEIELKYYERRPVIRKMVQISKPGRRVYAKASKIARVAKGLGIAILSTSGGVIADHEARERKLGGEVLCTVF